jgi:hypothetical protein
MLPRDWQSAESSLLCSSVATSADADGVVKCAVEVMHQLRLSKLLAAELCRQDTKKNAVLDCALVSPYYLPKQKEPRAYPKYRRQFRIQEPLPVLIL